MLKVQKKCIFFAEKFAYMRKKQYLCTIKKQRNNNNSKFYKYENE